MSLPPRPPVPSELMARMRGMARDTTPRETLPPDLAGELTREREARARDAAMLGEMFMRACDSDAKRRTSELAAEALAQRVATLESELREARAQSDGKERALNDSAEARARELEQRLHASEGKLREAEEKTRTAEEKRRNTEHVAAMLERAARASKDESASMSQRIELLENELHKARSQEESVAERAAGLARRVDELSVSASYAAELETQRARITDLERQLAATGDEATRTALRTTLAEKRVEELTSQLNDFDGRASRAEWELEVVRGELDTVKKRGGGLEAELARLVRKTSELERDRGIARRAEEEARLQVTTLRTEIEAARASGETQRVELERGAVERSAMDAALRTYADSASTVRAVLADLELEEARVGEARRRTFSDARQMLERAERRSTDATEVEASVREPAASPGTLAKRDETPTPISTPRNLRAAATTAVALPRPRGVQPVVSVPVPRSRQSLAGAAGVIGDPDGRKKS